MTRILLSKNINTYSITAHGHATGSTATCAAISALLYTVVGYIDNTDDIQMIDCRLDSGDAQITWQSDNNRLYKLAYIGLSQIAIDNQYCDITADMP